MPAHLCSPAVNTSGDDDDDSDDEDDIVIITVLPRRGPKHGHKAPSATTTTNPRASDPDTTQAHDQPDLAPAEPHVAQPDPKLTIIAALGPKGPPPPLKHTFWVETVAHRGLSSLDHEELGAVARLDRPQDGYVFPNRDYNWGEFAQLGLVWEVSAEDGREYLVPKLLQHVRLEDCPPFYCPVAAKMIEVLQAFRDARNDDCWH
jgi:hypothetical protein